MEQETFDSLMHCVESMLPPYIAGAFMPLDACFQSELQIVLNAFDVQHYNDFMELCPVSIKYRIKNWITSTANDIFSKVVVLSKHIIVSAYNAEKSKIAKDHGLQFHPFNLTKAEQAERATHFSRLESIMHWLEVEAFEMTLGSLESMFKMMHETTEKHLEDKANDYIDQQISSSIFGDWFEYFGVKKELHDLFHWIIELALNLAADIFEHIKARLKRRSQLEHDLLTAEIDALDLMIYRVCCCEGRKKWHAAGRPCIYKKQRKYCIKRGSQYQFVRHELLDDHSETAQKIREVLKKK